MNTLPEFISDHFIKIRKSTGNSVKEIKDRFVKDLAEAASSDALEAVRIQYLGKKGIITTLSKSKDMSSFSAEEKQAFYREFNDLKNFAADEMKKATEQRRGTGGGVKKGPAIDLTAPGTGKRLGALHPITLTQMELEQIFEGMGFSVYYGPEVESEFFCFSARTCPACHAPGGPTEY